MEEGEECWCDCVAQTYGSYTWQGVGLLLATGLWLP